MAESIQTHGRDSQRLELLDYLRFFAASIVLLYHYLFNGISDGKIVGVSFTPLAGVAKYGYTGVDLFFLISGFVIFNSAQGKSARRFAVGRAVRLYPAFWPAMLTTAAVITVCGGRSGLSVRPGQIMANLSMVPGLLHVKPVDGVYWTLQLELEFYFAIFIILLIGQGARLGRFLPVWILGMLAVSVAAPSLTSTPFLGNTFALFATGALIAHIRHQGLNPWRAAALAAGAFMCCSYGLAENRSYASESGTTYHKPVIVMLMLCFLALLLATCSTRVATLRLRRAMLVGAMTYPLYLVHAHIGYMEVTQLSTVLPLWLVYPITVASVLLLAFCIHIVFESGLASFWFKVFDTTLGRGLAVLQRLLMLPRPAPRHRDDAAAAAVG